MASSRKKRELKNCLFQEILKNSVYPFKKKLEIINTNLLEFLGLKKYLFIVRGQVFGHPRPTSRGSAVFLQKQLSPRS